jgi:hypothetical protein
MVKHTALLTLVALLCCAGAAAQSPGPCATQSSNLICVLPHEYGSTAFGFVSVLQNYQISPNAPPSLKNDFHPLHFQSDFSSTLQPLSAAIGRQANLLPLASPSSGIILVYDPALKTLVTGTDSLGPILGERAETVGRHRLFVGFSYQFFDFDKLDGINLHNFPNVLAHTNDRGDNTPIGTTPPTLCSTNTPFVGAVPVNDAHNLGGCAFVRDRIDTLNTISLKVNQYTTYVTFGLTKRIDVSMVIPIETVRFSLYSQDTIVPGSAGLNTPAAGSPNSYYLNQITNPSSGPGTNGAPYFFHLFKGCPNTSPQNGASFDPSCLNHTFPDFAFTGSGSQPKNSASGIGDVVARVKWNFWEGEHFGFAGGLDVRFATGDALNYLGSGSYGFRPFGIFSYRARISPHVLVGYEWNTDSVAAGTYTTGPNFTQVFHKGSLPNDFVYIAGADAWVTKWLTGAFDIVGDRVFSTQTVSVTQQQFLGDCGSCAPGSNPANVTLPSLSNASNQSYNVTNASMGVKVRPFPSFSKLVFSANVLVRLDDGGLKAKPAPLVGVGYTF